MHLLPDLHHLEQSYSIEGIYTEPLGIEGSFWCECKQVMGTVCWPVNDKENVKSIHPDSNGHYAVYYIIRWTKNILQSEATLSSQSR